MIIGLFHISIIFGALGIFSHFQMPGIHRVVITGIGAISPFGVGAEAFWNGLKKGVNPLVFNKELKSVVGTVPSTSDPCANYSAGQLREMNRSSIFAVEAATEALEDAGLAAVEDGFHNETAVNIGNFEYFEFGSFD